MEKGVRAFVFVLMAACTITFFLIIVIGNIMRATSIQKEKIKQRYSTLTFLKCSINSTPDENGVFSTYTIKKIEGNTVSVEYTHKDGIEEEVETEEYIIENYYFLNELINIFQEYEMYNYDSVLYSKIERPTDASETTYTFEFFGSDQISFSQYQKLPENASEGIRKLIKHIDTYINIAKNTPPEGKLVNVHYYTAGDMIGSYHSYELDLQPDGIYSPICTRYIEHQETHADEVVKSQNVVSRTLLDKIYVIMQEYDILSWTNLPLSEEYVLDAGTDYYSFKLEDGTVISFNSNNEWPENGYEAIREILKILQEE